MLLCWYASGCYVDCVLITVDRGFLVEVIRIGLLGICSSCIVALCVLFWIVAMRCSVAQIYPISYWLFCPIYILFADYDVRSLSFSCGYCVDINWILFILFVAWFLFTISDLYCHQLWFLLTVFTLRRSLRLVFLDVSWFFVYIILRVCCCGGWLSFDPFFVCTFVLSCRDWEFVGD